MAKKKKISKFRKENFLLKIGAIVSVLVAVVFIFGILIVNDFDIHSIFKDETITEVNHENDVMDIPEMAGESNILFVGTSDGGTYQRFFTLVQVDLENQRYEVCSFPINLKIGEKTISDIFKSGGGSLVRDKLSDKLNIEIDKYVTIKESNFKKMTNYLGTVTYSFAEDIRYSGSGDDSFSVRIKAGEQSLTGEQIIKLFRYSSEVQKDMKLQNELILTIINQIVNEENYEKSDELFRKLINMVDTDITVSNFSDSKETLKILSSSSASMTLFSVALNGNDENGMYEIDRKMQGEIEKYYN